VTRTAAEIVLTEPLPPHIVQRPTIKKWFVEGVRWAAGVAFRVESEGQPPRPAEWQTQTFALADDWRRRASSMRLLRSERSIGTAHGLETAAVELDAVLAVPRLMEEADHMAQAPLLHATYFHRPTQAFSTVCGITAPGTRTVLGTGEGVTCGSCLRRIERETTARTPHPEREA